MRLKEQRDRQPRNKRTDFSPVLWGRFGLLISEYSFSNSKRTVLPIANAHCFGRFVKLHPPLGNHYHPALSYAFFVTHEQMPHLNTLPVYLTDFIQLIEFIGDISNEFLGGHF